MILSLIGLELIALTLNFDFKRGLKFPRSLSFPLSALKQNKVFKDIVVELYTFKSNEELIRDAFGKTLLALFVSFHLCLINNIDLNI